MNKETMYHNIALACLKTLNSNSANDRKALIQALYEQIDHAFSEQFSLVTDELNLRCQQLDAIAHLSEKEHTLSDAIAIAANQEQAH